MKLGVVFFWMYIFVQSEGSRRVEPHARIEKKTKKSLVAFFVSFKNEIICFVVVIRQNLITFFDLGILDFHFFGQANVEIFRNVPLIDVAPHSYVAVDILGKKQNKKSSFYKRRAPL
jgi:hypothetical protein